MFHVKRGLASSSWPAYHSPPPVGAVSFIPALVLSPNEPRAALRPAGFAGGAPEVSAKKKCAGGTFQREWDQRRRHSLHEVSTSRKVSEFSVILRE